MHVKVKELKGKLAKSSRRMLMVSTLCGDDNYVGKVVGMTSEEAYKAIDNWTAHWKGTNDEKVQGDIAAATLLAFKDSDGGKNAVERARLFVKSLAGLLFEDKDALTPDDYCNAVVQLRLIGKDVLPNGKYRDPSQSRTTEEEEEPSVDKEKIKAFSSRKGKFRWKHVLKAANSAVEKSDTEEGKKAADAMEEEWAKKFEEYIEDSTVLKEKVCSFTKQFCGWTMEQVFGMNPDVLSEIDKSENDVKKTCAVFGHFVKWLKNNEPNAYIKYLAESTGEFSEEGENTKVLTISKTDDYGVDIDQNGVSSRCATPSKKAFRGFLGISIGEKKALYV